MDILNNMPLKNSQVSTNDI